MRYTILLALFLGNNPFVLFDFNGEDSLSQWLVVDDVVMGGISNGNFSINDAGNGLFEGAVSLENNGGFSSIRYNTEQRKVKGKTTAVLYIKGDGKAYQFGLKSNAFDRHSYIYTFQTSGEWEEVEIPLQEMYPGFRGRKLDMPNYPASTIGSCSILIANKKAERFRLEIDKVILK